MQGLGQGIDYRDAHAMQAARDSVATAATAKLAASMQDREDCLNRRLASGWVFVCGNASAIVCNLYQA